jgi:hypothetical protein
MKPKTYLIVVFAFLFWIISWGLNNALSQEGNSINDGFTIIGADGNHFFSTTSSSDLETLISQVPPRFALQYAGGLIYHVLEPAPEPLLTLLSQVDSHFIVQFAGGNHFYSTAYPSELIGDTSSPEVSNFQVISIGSNQAQISWTTNEYATTFLEYGTQSGNYTQQFDSNFYNLEHQVVLDNLLAGQIYYYQFGGTDRTGNSFLINEQQFTTQHFLFLPIVVRN